MNEVQEIIVFYIAIAIGVTLIAAILGDFIDKYRAKKPINSYQVILLVVFLPITLICYVFYWIGRLLLCIHRILRKPVINSGYQKSNKD